MTAAATGLLAVLLLVSPRLAPAVPARPRRESTAADRKGGPARVSSGEELRTALWQSLTYVVSVGPEQRAGAVRDFLQFGEEILAPVERLPAAERAERIRAAQPVLSQWRRLYRGLAPRVAKQLVPITRFLERRLR